MRMLKLNELNYMSTDCENRGWLKRQHHIIRMEAKGDKNYHSNNI